jgi:hypothetical protein
MNQELKYPQWQQPLVAAIMEFEHDKLRRKIETAEEAIGQRIQELALTDSDKLERRLLSDGLTIVRRVKRDRLAVRE